MKVITLLAGTANGQGEEEEEEEMNEEGDQELVLFIWIYTLALILVMNFGRIIASVGWNLTLSFKKWLTGQGVQLSTLEDEDQASDEREGEERRADPIEDQSSGISREGDQPAVAASSIPASSPGPASATSGSSSTSTLTPLTFEVFTTKTGLVYHTVTEVVST